MWHLFLDESGDLGFEPQSGSSPYLTLGILSVPELATTKAIRCAVAKTLRRKVNKRFARNQKTELKGHTTAIEVKRHFYDQIRDLDFTIYALTIEKAKFCHGLAPGQIDSAQIYNYLAGKVLRQIPLEAIETGVNLVIDRSKAKREVVKFDKYLLNQIEGRVDPSVPLSIRHLQSNEDHGLSAIDLFVWGIARFHAVGDTTWMTVYHEKVAQLEKIP